VFGVDDAVCIGPEGQFGLSGLPTGYLRESVLDINALRMAGKSQFAYIVSAVLAYKLFSQALFHPIQELQFQI
jgi:hypothetical protein